SGAPQGPGAVGSAPANSVVCLLEPEPPSSKEMRPGRAPASPYSLTITLWPSGRSARSSGFWNPHSGTAAPIGSHDVIGSTDRQAIRPSARNRAEAAMRRSIDPSRCRGWQRLARRAQRVEGEDRQRDRDEPERDRVVARERLAVPEHREQEREARREVLED